MIVFLSIWLIKMQEGIRYLQKLLQVIGKNWCIRIFTLSLHRKGNKTTSNYSQIVFQLCYSTHINHMLSIFISHTG